MKNNTFLFFLNSYNTHHKLTYVTFTFMNGILYKGMSSTMNEKRQDQPFGKTNQQSEKTYEYIKKRILDGIYKPSQRLTEQQLSKELDVSRYTVKMALLKLERENLVIIEKNKGATIKSFTREEVVNLLEIREVLEGLVTRYAAKNISDKELVELKKILDKMYVHIEEKDFDSYSRLNNQFHNIIYKASNKPQAVELIDMIKTQLIRLHFRTILIPERNIASYSEHKKIYEALKAHDEAKAQDAIKNHVRNIRLTIENNYELLS